jgi:hypothetical protein
MAISGTVAVTVGLGLPGVYGWGRLRWYVRLAAPAQRIRARGHSLSLWAVRGRDRGRLCREASGRTCTARCPRSGRQARRCRPGLVVTGLPKVTLRKACILNRAHQGHLPAPRQRLLASITGSAQSPEAANSIRGFVQSGFCAIPRSHCARWTVSPTRDRAEPSFILTNIGSS